MEEAAPSINVETLKSNILGLGNIGLTDSGLSRPSLSPQDTNARKFVVGLMKEVGLTISVDQAGNIIGTRAGKDSTLSAIGFGSHIDTVKNAGKLDGCYGFLSAIEVIRSLNNAEIRTNHPLRLICFTDEEGARFRILLGSSAVSSSISKDELHKITDSGDISFSEALKRAGYKIEDLSPLSKTLDNLCAFFELHIEQGPILEAEGVSIGVVTSIVGLRQLIVKILGTQSHAGTTPMGMRRDPMIGAAEIILEVNRIARIISNTSVGTVGLLKVSPGAANVIPKIVEMTVDLRDVSADSVQKAVDEVSSATRSICSRLGLDVEIYERTSISPAIMGDRAMQSIKRSSEKLGLSLRFMPSGAGHDSQNVSRVVKETGMIFVPSHGGISHSPEEWTDWIYLEQGANVLLFTILDYDSL